MTSSKSDSTRLRVNPRLILTFFIFFQVFVICSAKKGEDSPVSISTKVDPSQASSSPKVSEAKSEISKGKNAATDAAKAEVSRTKDTVKDVKTGSTIDKIDESGSEMLSPPIEKRKKRLHRPKNKIREHIDRENSNANENAKAALSYVKEEGGANREALTKALRRGEEKESPDEADTADDAPDETENADAQPPPPKDGEESSATESPEEEGDDKDDDDAEPTKEEIDEARRLAKAKKKAAKNRSKNKGKETTSPLSSLAAGAAALIKPKKNGSGSRALVETFDHPLFGRK